VKHKLLFLAALAFFVFGGFLISQRLITRTVDFQDLPSEYFSSSDNHVVHIAIPAVHIALPVIEGDYQNATWPTSKTSIVHISSSVEPGKSGNSILYGHNWPNLLGNLKNTQIGQEIEIGYANKSKKTFTITSIQTVNPDNTEVLKNTSESQVTLYTCIGFLDSKRLVVMAKASS